MLRWGCIICTMDRVGYLYHMDFIHYGLIEKLSVRTRGALLIFVCILAHVTPRYCGTPPLCAPRYQSSLCSYLSHAASLPSPATDLNSTRIRNSFPVDRLKSTNQDG